MPVEKKDYMYIESSASIGEIKIANRIIGVLTQILIEHWGFFLALSNCYCLENACQRDHLGYNGDRCGRQMYKFVIVPILRYGAFPASPALVHVTDGETHGPSPHILEDCTGSYSH